MGSASFPFFGVYLSPWDRNDPAYGTPEYNEKFIRTLQDVHGGRYGQFFEQWFDGACGEGPTGKKQVYDWPAFNQTVLSMSPSAVIFSDVGPGCRWMGNERGIACETNWSKLDVEGFTPGAGAPPRDTLQQGFGLDPCRNGCINTPGMVLERVRKHTGEDR